MTSRSKKRTNRVALFLKPRSQSFVSRKLEGVCQKSTHPIEVLGKPVGTKTLETLVGTGLALLIHLEALLARNTPGASDDGPESSLLAKSLEALVVAGCAPSQDHRLTVQTGMRSSHSDGSTSQGCPIGSKTLSVACQSVLRGGGSTVGASFHGVLLGPLENAV